MSKMASFFFSSYKFLSTFMGKGVESDKKARDKNKWEDFWVEGEVTRAKIRC